LLSVKLAVPIVTTGLQRVNMTNQLTPGGNRQLSEQPRSYFLWSYESLHISGTDSVHCEKI